MQSKIYHVVKNIDGAHDVFNDMVSNKQCQEVYTLFIELPGTRYLHVLCEI